jgi:hypothetical protein
MTTGAAPVASETRFHGRSRLRARRGGPWPRGIALAHVLRMNELRGRGQPQRGEVACKTEESPSFTVDERLVATLSGLRARVQLRLQLRAPGPIRRARGLFAHLARTERYPSTLSDAFYARVGFAPAERLRAHKIRVSLLKPSSSATAGIDGARR